MRPGSVRSCSSRQGGRGPVPPAGGAGGAAGLLTPEIHEWSDPDPFVDLARASLELWSELEQTWPGGVGLIELDWIGLAADPDGFAPHQRAAVEWLAHG